MQLLLAGPFRSGTNWVQALLELNFDVTLEAAAGFKHAPVPASTTGPVLGVLRDPYAWLVSLWRYVNDVGANHTVCADTWGTFLVSPLEVFHGGIEGFPHFRFANPVDYHNAMACNLLSLDERHNRVLRYEDVLADPEATITEVAAGFGLTRTSDTFRTVSRKTRNLARSPDSDDVGDYTTDVEFVPPPLADAPWMASFTRRQRRAVRHRLDDELVRRLSYPVATG